MKFNIYHGDDEVRFVLGRQGDRKLFVMGLNPSTADAENSDQTIAKVQGFARRKNCDGLVMLNLCALRSKTPTILPKTKDENGLAGSIERNCEAIQRILEKEKGIVIWAAWGHNIAKRQYLFDCLRGIARTVADFDVEWEKCGEATKGGHPRHPSRLGYDVAFKHFDIERYLQTHS